MKQKQIHISDHGLVRYLERVRGFDLDREREAIRKICGNAQEARVKIDGHIFIVERGILVSVIPDYGPNKTMRERVMGKANAD